MKRLLLTTGITLVATACGTATLPVAPGLPAETSRTMARRLADTRGDSALVRHVRFFDADGDRQITMGETKDGLKALGLGVVQASGAALLINGFLGPKTSGRLTTTVSVDGIAKGIHGSDTGIFDRNGQFVAARFEQQVSSNDVNRDGALDETEIDLMIRRNKDDSGLQAAKAEWKILLQVGADREAVVGGERRPALSKARLQAFYDGTLFYQLANSVAAR